jgi:NCS2 family nucleobase:cation symporter-2
MGAKLPMIEGVSFAGVAALSAVAVAYKDVDPKAGLLVMFGATMASGIFAFLAAPLFGKLLKYFPDLVSGTVVTCMGLSLVPVAIRWAGGGNPGAADFGSMPNLALAFMTLGIILIIQKLSKGFLGNISILIGIFAGTIIGIFMGVTDFSSIGNAQVFMLNTPFYFGFPKFEISAILSLIIVQMIIMTDAMGNQINLTDIVGEEVDAKRLSSGLKGHAFTSILSGMFNSFPHSLFGQNVGVVAMTGVKSRYAGTVAGLMLLTASFFPKLIALLTSIPSPVLGGAGIVMFGIVAANGIKRLGTVNYNGNRNLVIVAVSVGLALVPMTVPQIFNFVPAWGQLIFKSPIILGGLSVVILNILFNEIGRKK